MRGHRNALAAHPKTPSVPRLSSTGKDHTDNHPHKAPRGSGSPSTTILHAQTCAQLTVSRPWAVNARQNYVMDFVLATHRYGFSPAAIRCSRAKPIQRDMVSVQIALQKNTNAYENDKSTDRVKKAGESENCKSKFRLVWPLKYS